MRVIVTGGAGFIGSHVADALVKRGDEVTVVDDLSAGKRENVPSGVDFIQLDIRDGDAVASLVDDVRPEAISHHAAQASVAVSVREPVLDAQINILGSIHLAQAALKHNARLVFASTGGALYGEVPQGAAADVSWPAKPLSPYACSKAAFELYLKALANAEGLATTVLRYGNVYGPRQDPHGEAGVVAIFLQRLLRGEPIQVNARAKVGDDGCVRDYVYVGDVVAANLAALDGKLATDVLNVGTGVGSSTRQLAQTLSELVGGEHEIRDGAHRAGDLERSVLDPSVFVQALGAPVDLATGLAETTAWFRVNAGD